MNISEMARRLQVPTEELRDALPGLGFKIGRKAIKVPDREANRIMDAWREAKHRERLMARREEQQRKAQAQRSQEKKVLEKSVSLPVVLTVREFATRLGLPIARVMQELMKNGILASINERIDFDTAGVIAEDFGFAAKREDADASSALGGAGPARRNSASTAKRNCSMLFGKRTSWNRRREG
jgi:translation initiation factor IF-2